ncbi:MAG: diguanylate cyclase, partial [Candidatus Eremiobacteraeota bacterium]|nr:diguanylate cyclase [Candidatus Eremiobacteraeota bacterium]
MRRAGTLKIARVVAMAIAAAYAAGIGPAAASSSWQRLANPVFIRIDIRGLPEPYPTALAQDDAGFIWVGTAGGLSRFDGYHFKNYLPNPADPAALPDGYVNAMLAARGGLWLATQSSGLVRFDSATETFRTWRADSTARTGPRSTNVNAVAASGDGALWVGGDGGLDRFDPQRNAFQPMVLQARGTRPRSVQCILVDRRHTVWVGTPNGLYRRQVGGHRFTPLSLTGGNQPAIWSLYEDTGGRLWVGSVNALFVLDRDGRAVASFTSSSADAATLADGQQAALIETTPGTIWAGSEEGGVSVVDFASRRIRRVTTDPSNPAGLPPGERYQFLRDRSGLIWTASGNGGLLLYNPLSRGLFDLSASRADLGLSDAGGTALAFSRGRLWIGGTNGSLVALDEAKGPSAQLVLPNHATPRGMFASPGGSLWIATQQGLCELPSGSDTPRCRAGPSKVWNARAYAVLEAGGTLWVGTTAGIVAQDERSGAIATYRHDGSGNELSNDFVRTLYRDRSGAIWAGTANGLDRIDPRTHRVTRFEFDARNSNSVGLGRIEAILEDRRGRIWAGADGGPLNVLQLHRDGSVEVRHLDRADGMPHENVDGLAQDSSGRIWASTDKGLAIVDPNSLRARALGPIDGVSDADYWAAVAQSPDGTIFFGGAYGVTVLAPGAASPWNYSPPLVVTGLTLGGRGVPAARANAGTPVELPAGNHMLSAEFASLDFSDPQALRYSYKLDGYDRNWTDGSSENRVATYTNLAPGNYTLRVRGTNRLGVWSERALALSVAAVPAWNETWWFRTLVALALLALVAWLMLAIARAAARRSNEARMRAEKESERLASELARQRAEEALRLSEAQFRAVFEGAAVGIAVLDRGARVLDSNGVFKSIFGDTIETAIAGHEHELSELLRGQRDTFEYERHLRTPQGQEIWTDATVSVVNDAGGKPLFGICMFRDKTELKQSERRSLYDKTHDGLTGLPNRGLFEEQLRQRFQKADPALEAFFAVIYVGLEHYRDVYESLGHAAGDDVLVRVSQRLRASVDARDVVARLGSDEFAILLQSLGDILHVESVAR